MDRSSAFLGDMKILVLLNSVYTGGAEFSTLSFYGWMFKQGYEIKLVCCKRATPSYDPDEFGLHDVHYLPEGSFWLKLRELNAVIKQFQPVLVHSVLYDANMLGRMSRLHNRSFIHLESLVNETYSKHRLREPNITWFKLSGYRLMDFITQLVGVDHFHANSETVSLHYQHKLWIAPKRITVIPRGREPNCFVNDSANRNRIRKDLHSAQRIIFMNVARHEYQKGQDVLLDALVKIKDRKNIQVVIVGRQGKLTEQLQNRIKEFHIEDCVTLLGHRTDVSSLLAAADVFVFPSRFEGLPGALIEAEAAGLPILASDISSNREVAEENRNAFFFPVDDSESLSSLIDQMTNDNEQRAQMGKKSLNIFRRKFDMETINQRMLSLLQKLVRKG